MSKINTEKWSEFVFHHPHGNVFQTPELYNLWLRADNYEPIIISITKGNEITGVLLAAIQKESNGILGFFSARSLIIGGPLIKNDEPEYLIEILQKYSHAIKGKSIYTQFRNLYDWKGELKEVFKKKGYRYEPHLNILIDITNYDKLLDGISKNKKRNIIKSKNKGLIFKEIEKSDLEKSILLIQATYKKIGLPFPSRKYIQILYNELHQRNLIKIFGAYYNNDLIACRLELLYKGVIYDWYAGADDEMNSKYPNDFLIYNTLLWGNGNNFKLFDFGGAGRPGKHYGVREHKLKFSNNLVEFGRFEITHKPLLMLIGKTGLFFLKQIQWIREHILRKS